MPSKRRPPWGATKKQSETFSKERALRNQVHDLEKQLALATADRQKLIESNVRMADDLRVAREEVVQTETSFKSAMGVSFSRGDLNAAKDEVLHVATSIVEAFARGLAAGKGRP